MGLDAAVGDEHLALQLWKRVLAHLHRKSPGVLIGAAFLAIADAAGGETCDDSIALAIAGAWSGHGSRKIGQQLERFRPDCR
jgi:hypothetical protein